MVGKPVTLAGSVDDIHGLGVTVYQDHEGVVIEAGGIGITLSRPAVYELMNLLSGAVVDAAIWDASQELGTPDE